MWLSLAQRSLSKHQELQMFEAYHCTTLQIHSLYCHPSWMCWAWNFENCPPVQVLRLNIYTHLLEYPGISWYVPSSQAETKPWGNLFVQSSYNTLSPMTAVQMSNKMIQQKIGWYHIMSELKERTLMQTNKIREERLLDSGEWWWQNNEIDEEQNDIRPLAWTEHPCCLPLCFLVRAPR